MQKEVNLRTVYPILCLVSGGFARNIWTPTAWVVVEGFTQDPIQGAEGKVSPAYHTMP